MKSAVLSDNKYFTVYMLAFSLYTPLIHRQADLNKHSSDCGFKVLKQMWPKKG